MPPISPLNWMRLILLGAMFGAAFMFTKLALDGVGPRLVVASRLGVGALLLLIIVTLRGTGLPPCAARAQERSGPLRLAWGSALMPCHFFC